MKTILDSGTHKVQIPNGAIINAPEVIRIITVGAFRKRLPSLTRKEIRNSVDDSIIDLRENLELASYIDLDDEELQKGIDFLKLLEWITDEEIKIIFSDGTQKEKFNGVM